MLSAKPLTTEKASGKCGTAPERLPEREARLEVPA
jgi:hypothetical protein